MRISIFQTIRSGFALAFALAALALVLNAQTTIVNYSFNAGLTPDTTAFAVTGSAVTSGQAITNGPTGVATDGLAFTANATAGNRVSIPDANQPGTNYFQFDLGGASLPYYTTYKVYVQANPLVSAAPNTLTLSYDPGCTGTYTNFGTTLALPGTNVWTSGVFDVSGIAALNNQTTNCFRLTGSGTFGANKALGLDNFQVQATLVTGASVTIGGRVLTSEGRAISRARVTMTDQSGTVRYALTNPFGYYRFAEVESGTTNVFSVRAKGYQFAEPLRVISVTEELSDVNFIALPSVYDLFSTPRLFSKKE